MALFGSGTAGVWVGDLGSRNSPPEWELLSDGRRLQRAFRKLEAFQEARGADRRGRERAGGGGENGEREGLCPLPTETSGAGT